MNFALWANISGLLGDIVTFAGAILIATGEAGERKRARQIRAMTEIYEVEPGLRKLRFRIGSTEIQNADDIEDAVIGSFSRRAIIGAWILVAGFAFLLTSRILEICK
jgi:hypothetical protein